MLATSWSETFGSRIYKEHSLMFNVALRCWDKLDSQKTANVLTLLLLLSFFLLCSQFSPNIIPSGEITSVEKPAMLMVAITNIKCNTLLFATRFIQQRHSLENTMQASKSVSLYFIVPKLVSWVLTSWQWILINRLGKAGFENFSMFGKLKSDTEGNSLGCWETFWNFKMESWQDDSSFLRRKVDQKW